MPARVSFSPFDCKYLRKYNPNGIEIVIAFNPVERTSPISTNCFTAGGCISDNDSKYRFDIGAYYLSPADELESRWPRRAKLSIPISKLRNVF